METKIKISRLKKILSQVKQGDIKNKDLEHPKFKIWRTSAVRNLKKIYGEEHDEVIDFEDLEFCFEGSYDSDADLNEKERKCFLSDLDIAINYIKSYIEELEEELEVEENKKRLKNPKVSFDKTKVFIVHGHDDLVKTEVENLLRRLDVEPIILHQQTSSSDTIIEKIERYSNVGFGIVLYTPCDIGNTKDKKDELNFRARQNVVFEHGFLIGKIGRKNVCALKKENLETPGDIGGIVYTPMDPYGAWEIELAKEMKSSGYDIDMNKL